MIHVAVYSWFEGIKAFVKNQMAYLANAPFKRLDQMDNFYLGKYQQTDITI